MALTVGSLKDLKMWVGVLAEFFACFLMMFVIVFLQVNHEDTLYNPSTFQTGMAVGILVMVLVDVFGPISGGFVNPVATFSFFLDGRMPLVQALLYIMAQMTGTIAGSFLVKILTPYDMEFQAIVPTGGMTPYNGLAIEVVLSVVLFFTCLSVTDHTIRKVDDAVVSRSIGLCIGCVIMSVAQCTGAVMNPLISLGPAVITGNFTHNWIYWVGGYSGGVIAVIVYKILRFGVLYTKNSKGQADDQSSSVGSETTDYKVQPALIL